MNRRHFLRSLALGAGLLTLRFRPEAAPELKIKTIPLDSRIYYRGASFLEAGYVHAPYIPIYVTRDIVSPDLKPLLHRPLVNRPLVNLHPAELARHAKYGGYEKYLGSSPA